MHVYAMPGGELSQTIDADQWVWNSATDFLFLRLLPESDRGAERRSQRSTRTRTVSSETGRSHRAGMPQTNGKE